MFEICMDQWDQSRISPSGLFGRKNAFQIKSSVPNSSSRLIFVKVRVESGRIFSKNQG